MLSRFFEKNGGKNDKTGLRTKILHGANFFRVRDSARRQNKYANIDKP